MISCYFCFIRQISITTCFINPLVVIASYHVIELYKGHVIDTSRIENKYGGELYEEDKILLLGYSCEPNSILIALIPFGKDRVPDLLPSS